MFAESAQVVALDYFLKPGFIYVPTKPAVISTVLGSSVAVCIYDKKNKFGGMANFQLPYIDDHAKTTARYGNVATLTLIRMLLHEGVKRKHLEAQLFGGAYINNISPRNIGRENIEVARKILAHKRIRLVSEDIGGAKGRKVVFNTHTCDIAVLRVDNLRKGDWFPYEEKR